VGNPRRIGDRDAIAWFEVHSLHEHDPCRTAQSHGPASAPIPKATGRDGGHDLHYRTLQAMGVRLVGHLLGAEDGRAHFASDLADSVAFGDARYDDIRELVKKSALDKGLPVPEMPAPPPFVADAPDSVDLVNSAQRWSQSASGPTTRAGFSFRTP